MSEHVARRRIAGKLLPAAGAGVVGILLIMAVLDLPRVAGGLSQHVAASLEQSGVYHPVTAVLLNFRAYDTWFELGVLLLGMLGVLALRSRPSLHHPAGAPDVSDVLRSLVRILVPLMVLVGGYLLWLGKYSAGGAFQAGVVIGVAGVLLWLAGFGSVALLSDAALRLLLVCGFGAFALTAVGTLLVGRAALDLPEAYAGTLILGIEVLATVSIAITITALLVGLQPSRDAAVQERETNREDR
jgi:multisubunit Na+/H+ antiporter MnhB subunit